MRKSIDVEREKMAAEREEDSDFEEFVLDQIAQLRVGLADTVLQYRFLSRAIGFSAEVGGEQVDADNRRAPVETLNLTADLMPDEGCGLHYVEFPERGAPFRWSGPERDFHFVLNIERRSEKKGRLYFNGAIVDENISGLRVFVDGAKTSSHRPFRRKYIEFRLPPLQDQPRYSHISFVTPRVFRPHDLDEGSGDMRELGICITKLEIIGR